MSHPLSKLHTPARQRQAALIRSPFQGRPVAAASQPMNLAGVDRVSVGAQPVNSFMGGLQDFAKGILGNLFGGGGAAPAPTADHAQAENMVAAQSGAPMATADHAQAENMVAARSGVPMATADHAQAENMIAAQPTAPSVAPAGYMGMHEGNAIHGRGASGAEVRSLQESLKALGADIEVDGKYGPKTQAAVREFQEKHNIKVDGLAGPQTRATINGAKRAEAEKKAEAEKVDTPDSKGTGVNDSALGQEAAAKADAGKIDTPDSKGTGVNDSALGQEAAAKADAGKSDKSGDSSDKSGDKGSDSKK